MSRAEVETWRTLALYLLLFGITGTAAELVLLEHMETVWQWTPIALLGGGLLSGSVLALRPGRASVAVFRALMVAYLPTAALGLYLHLKSNMEFEREMLPSISGLELMVESLHGAMPALAPGAMAQLGLLGLLVSFRHPALRTSRPEEGPAS